MRHLNARQPLLDGFQRRVVIARKGLALFYRASAYLDVEVVRGLDEVEEVLQVEVDEVGVPLIDR